MGVARVLGGAIGLLLCLAAPAAARLPGADAARQPFELQAETLEYDSRRDLYEARGSVVIRQRGTTLRCEWLVFHDATGRGVASGGVEISDGGDTLSADFLAFNVFTFEGVAFNARLDAAASGFEMVAGAIARTGDQTYRLEHGSFTTCRCPEEGRDPWRIRAERTDLEIGGYGTARNTTFDVLGVPVAWLPWMIYPLKTERQTGFLFPEFAYGSRNGADIGLPFFWAVADPLNVILAPHWLSKRGFKNDAELDYVVGEKSRGGVFASYLHDERVDPNSLAEPFDNSRWTALGTQDFFLAEGAHFKSNFAFVSDNQYPIDFSELRQHRYDRFLESVAFVDKGMGRSGELGLVTSALYANDMQNPDNEDRDAYLLQRFPWIEFDALPTPMGPGSRLVPALDVQFINYQPFHQATSEFPIDLAGPGAVVVGDRTFLDTGIDALPDVDELGFIPVVNPDPNRDDVSLGGPERDGLFEEGEPLPDKGQRFVFRPRLALPWRLFDRLELYPEIGWNQTLWQSVAQGIEERGGFFGRLEARAGLQRQVSPEVTHLLEPRVGWVLATKNSASGDPLYQPGTAVPQRRLRQLDLDNIALDPADRVDDFHAVTLGAGNRFYRRRGAGQAPALLADVALSSEYRLDDEKFGWLILDGRAYPLRHGSTRFSFGFDPEKGVVSEALTDLAWSFGGGHRVALGYRYLRDVPEFFEDFDQQNKRYTDFKQMNRVSQLNVSARLALTERWAATYDAAYSFADSFLITNRGGIEYTSACRCWAAAFELAEDRAYGVQFNLRYRFIGLGADAGFGSSGGLGPGSLDGF